RRVRDVPVGVPGRQRVHVVGVQMRVAVRMVVEEAAADQRARQEEEGRTGQRDEPLHRRTAETAPTPTAASAQASTSRAPTFRSGPSQTQTVFMISLRLGTHEVSSAGRTPHVTASTDV